MPGIMTTWVQLQEAFLRKFFSMHRTQALQGHIMHFAQKQDESIYHMWERFKETLLQCPHHGYTLSNLLAFFYNGLTPKMKEYVELMCNDQFFEKTQYEAWAYIETIAEHATRLEPRPEGNDSFSAPVGGEA